MALFLIVFYLLDNLSIGDDMFYCLNTFFVYSILGYLLESISFLMTGYTGNSGIFYGPWTPVYGIGVLLILLLQKLIFKDNKPNRWLKVIILFITVTITLTVIEWIGGELIEFFFHTVFWDYRDHRYHLGKYVALDMSLLWGVLSIAFLYLIHPWMDKLVQKIPYFITCTLVTLFMIDIICTFVLR